MALKVEFTATARKDLRAIGDWIARDSPVRAASFVEEFEQRAASLAEMPRRFRIAYRTGRGPVHQVAHGRYLIRYRVFRHKVSVIGIVHGARVRD